MVQISEVKGNKRDNRTAAHTHIKGLGLKSDGRAEKSQAGFVGQGSAREVSAICHCLHIPTSLSLSLSLSLSFASFCETRLQNWVLTSLSLWDSSHAASSST